MVEPKAVSAHSIDQLYSKTAGLEARVTGIEAGLTNLSDKMDGVIKAVTVQSAQPQYNVRETLDTVFKMTALASLLASGIIFIATSISSAPLASIEQRLKFDTQRLDRIERALEVRLTRLDAK